MRWKLNVWKGTYKCWFTNEIHCDCFSPFQIVPPHWDAKTRSIINTFLNLFFSFYFILGSKKSWKQELGRVIGLLFFLSTAILVNVTPASFRSLKLTYVPSEVSALGKQQFPLRDLSTSFIGTHFQVSLFLYHRLLAFVPRAQELVAVFTAIILFYIEFVFLVLTPVSDSLNNNLFVESLMGFLYY